MELPEQTGSPKADNASDQYAVALPKTRPRRPCDSCRRRKSRCEMAEGATTCVLCLFHHQHCTFVEEPRPRKRKITALHEDENLQASLGREIPRRPGRDSAERESDQRRSSIDGPRRSSHPSIRQDPPIDDYANLKGPSLLKKTLGLQNHRHSCFLGSTSVYEQAILDLGTQNDKDEVPAGRASLRRVGNSHRFLLVPDEGTRNHEDEIDDLDEIETIVAPHGQALIYLYFRIVHPSYPILHKHVFLEKYQRTHREFSPPLLAAVYILALNWWSYSSELALLPKPDVPRLERLAFKTMSDVIYRPKLSTIQAGLLLLQRPEGNSWALTTKLVGLAQDLGLHIDCSDWKIPAWERGLRKRLAWAMFMQDKWGALVHGRPSHISPADWDVRPVTEIDFPENAADEDDEDGSTEVEKGRILFCEMVKLTGILSEILATFYTLKAERELRQSSSNGVRGLLEKCKPIQIRLREWFNKLPNSLRLENLTMRKLSSSGSLHLAYYVTEMTLHRCIIRSLAHEPDVSLIQICRSAARARLITSMDFVKSLRPEHLQSFWYSASKYCFAVVGTYVSLLWVTAQSQEEAEFYRTKLEEYRWTLRLFSKSDDFLERAIALMASSTGVLIKQIPEKPFGAAMLTSVASAFPSPEEVESLPHTSPTGTSAVQEGERSPSAIPVLHQGVLSEGLWYETSPSMNEFLANDAGMHPLPYIESYQDAGHENFLIHGRYMHPTDEQQD